MLFENFWKLRVLTEVKEVTYGRTVDNTLLRHALLWAQWSSQQEHGTKSQFPVLRSGQLPPQLHATLAQILLYQTEAFKRIRNASLADHQSLERDATFKSRRSSAEGTGHSQKFDKKIQFIVCQSIRVYNVLFRRRLNAEGAKPESY